MATAKRVKQPDHLRNTTTPRVTETFRVVLVDGKEVRREAMGSPTTTHFWSVERTPQPDRIVMEMSVEEAQQLRIQLGHCNGVHADTYETFKTLRDALSSYSDTQTSPAKDAAGGALDPQYYSKGLTSR